MSATLKNLYAAVPATTRGKPLHVGGDPKGNNLLYACGSAVYIRNVKDPLKAEMYTEHQHATTVARYSPSGFYIASGDISGTIRIWDTTQVEHVLKIELKMLSGPILDLQWSDDSKRIVCVGEGKEKFGAVFMFDSGSSVGEISGHSKNLASCDFKQTRPYRVATGGEDMLVNFFEGPPFKYTKSIKDHTRFVTCVRFSPNGEKLLTVGLDKVGFFFDGKTGDPVGKLSTTNGHNGGIYSCSWSPDSKRVLTASADKTCKIWDSTSGECLTTFTFGEAVEDQQLGCLWQGDELLSFSLGGDVSYLDEKNPSKPKRVVKGHNKAVTAIAYDQSSGSLFSAAYDAQILNWDIATGATSPFSGKGHTNQVNRIFVQGNDLVSAGMDDTIRFTPKGSKQYAANAVKLDSAPADIAVGKKDTALVLAVITDAVVVLRGGQVVNKLAVKYQPAAVALSVDETTVAVGGRDNDIRLYSLRGNNLEEKTVLKGHRGSVSCVQFSPDGNHLASSDWNRDIFVWDLKSNQIKINGWQFHSARVNYISWAPSGNFLVSGGIDANVYVWNVQNPSARIFIKNAHQGGVNGVLFLDDQTIVSAGQDSSIKTWSLKW